MKKILVAFFLLFASDANAEWTTYQMNQLSFIALEIFSGSPADGSIVVTGNIPRQRTAIDLWPHNGELPSQHALAETVWYRTRFQDWPRFERFSLSAMGGQGHYRFNVEAGGGGEYKPIFFCFDGLTADSDCSLRIYPLNQGIFVCEFGGQCYNLLEVARKVMK